MNKLCDLLQTNKDPDYPSKRLHINEMTYANNDYLTIPKSLSMKGIKGIILKKSASLLSDNNSNSNNKANAFEALTLKCQLRKNISIDNSSLMNKYLLYNNALDSNNERNIISYSNECNTKILFEQLSTKNNNNMTPRSINFTHNSFLSSNNWKMYNSPPVNKQTNDPIEKLYEVMDKYSSKISLLRNIKKKETHCSHRIGKLNNIDLFRYDSQRWQKNNQVIEMQKQEQNQTRELTKRTLLKYTSSIEKLNKVISQLELKDKLSYKTRRDHII